mmetsp:Transcript_142707/g.443843  ORF Transcript_142707/g.443843 Transcript_142707/m.443843 type:complete len:246 (+) Transcript_142707:753-1490(+)
MLLKVLSRSDCIANCSSFEASLSSIVPNGGLCADQYVGTLVSSTGTMTSALDARIQVGDGRPSSALSGVGEGDASGAAATTGQGLTSVGVGSGPAGAAGASCSTAAREAAACSSFFFFTTMTTTEQMQPTRRTPPLKAATGPMLKLGPSSFLSSPREELPVVELGAVMGQSRQLCDPPFPPLLDDQVIVPTGLTLSGALGPLYCRPLTVRWSQQPSVQNDGSALMTMPSQSREGVAATSHLSLCP